MALALSGSLVLAAQTASLPDAPAADVAGPARVIDGDTLVVAGVRVRLEGIDAPETGQTCERGSAGPWECGAAATKELSRLTEGRTVTCRSKGTDKYGRMLGVCFAGGEDLNELMVRRGLAWAFLRYSQSYVEAEREARAARIGIWQGETEAPWDYRARQWALAEAAGNEAPAGCAIKGNVSRHGHIYHLPWSPWYGKVRIDPARGERWFCSEAEAIAAGWRPANVVSGSADRAFQPPQ